MVRLGRYGWIIGGSEMRRGFKKRFARGHKRRGRGVRRRSNYQRRKGARGVRIGFRM
ncbi:MAG: hypothetical protein [Microviridae sp. ctYqV29]|nr:MAG: hypothetical protein [Microviridae sp. ctYqV29]